VFKNIRWQIRLFFILWILFLYIVVKPPFTFLVLNTFLGYIPIELSLELTNQYIEKSWVFWPILILWLIFYPNAPYLLTDLFHLSLLNPYSNIGLLRLSGTMWVNYAYLIISALGCSLIGFYGLFQVVKRSLRFFNINSKYIKIIIILILNLISSIGIYIGRFLRFHTIYLILSPRLVLKQLTEMWTFRMLMFVFILTLVQSFVYWILYLIIKDTKTTYTN
jgi:uncharacterized membrane protein